MVWGCVGIAVSKVLKAIGWKLSKADVGMCVDQCGGCCNGVDCRDRWGDGVGYKGGCGGSG